MEHDNIRCQEEGTCVYASALYPMWALDHDPSLTVIPARYDHHVMNWINPKVCIRWRSMFDLTSGLMTWESKFETHEHEMFITKYCLSYFFIFFIYFRGSKYILIFLGFFCNILIKQRFTWLKTSSLKTIPQNTKYYCWGEDIY